MSHVVILLDKDGNEYPFYPEHNDGGRMTQNALIPFITLDASKPVWKSKTQWLTPEANEKAKAKAMKSKRMCDISMCPPELLEQVKEIYG